MAISVRDHQDQHVRATDSRDRVGRATALVGGPVDHVVRVVIETEDRLTYRLALLLQVRRCGGDEHAQRAVAASRRITHRPSIADRVQDRADDCCAPDFGPRSVFDARAVSGCERNPAGSNGGSGCTLTVRVPTTLARL